MGEEKKDVTSATEEARFPELEELQRDVEKRIRDNQRFLERFMDEDFPDEEESEDGDEGEIFEEL